MRIQLFDFIDDTLEYYERKMPSFEYAQKQVMTAFQNMFSDKTDSIVNYHTRIKKLNSLKEKLIRSKCVDEDENAFWLIDYWCGKDVKGLIQMPFSRHWIMHIEVMRRIRNKWTF